MRLSMSRRLACLALLAAMPLAGATVAVAYPTAPVTMVVPYPAGTSTDAFSRIFARLLENQLGQKFLVENRPGANGMNGTETVTRAKPDGYTFLFTTNSPHTTVQYLYKKVPYDGVKDFEPVAILYSGSPMFVVRPELGIETLPQLIAYAKANPGKINIGTANASGQIAVELLKKRASIDVVGVPYRGTPQALSDLLGGSVQLISADIASAGSQVESGKLKAVAFFSKDRNPAYPNVATFHETTAPGVDLSTWSGVVAPKNTPKEVTRVIAEALRKALEHPDVTQHAARIGSTLKFVGPQEMETRLADDAKRWGDMIAEAGIQPE
jgi:tripartite-type tricarboxylate transporter receptor subunit TctC